MSPIRGYHILSLIGGGSYGIVVKAEKNNQPYAIKIYCQDYLTKRGFAPYPAAELFQRERDILQRITHPSIPACLDFFTEKHMHFLVQSYIPSPSLADHISSGIVYSENQIREILFRLLTLLHFLHEPSDVKPAIVHRDIRLSNLLYSDTGLFLVDFGLACRLEHKEDMASLEKGLLTIAAAKDDPSYATLRNDFSPQCDLFGAGVATVDLFTNAVPADENIPWEDRFLLSPPLKTFIRKLLGKEPSFLSSREALQELSQL